MDVKSVLSIESTGVKIPGERNSGDFRRERNAVGKGRAEVLHDPIRKTGNLCCQYFFKTRIAQVKKGGDWNDGGKHFKAKLKSANEIAGDFLKTPVFVDDKMNENHDEDCRSSDKRRRFVPPI